jgi:hypothetical protein
MAPVFPHRKTCHIPQPCVDLGPEIESFQDGASGIRVAFSERVPELSRFFGVVIGMHYNDHAPPHLHARYGRDRASIALRGFGVLEGSLPPRVLGLVIEWAAQHQDELLADWARAARRLPLVPIAPLEE